MHQLFVVEHVILGPVAVFAKKVSVVGGENENGIIPQVEFIHLVEELAEPDVGHRQSAGVTFADVLNGGFVLANGGVVGPVEVITTVPVVAVEVAVFFWAGEGLVRVEALDVQVPVVGVVVAVEEFDGLLETLRCWVVLIALSIHQCAVGPIGAAIFAAEFEGWRLVDKRTPDIALLAAQKLPGVELCVVILAARMKIVVVVGNHVAIGAALPAQFGLQAVVPRLDRAPGGFEEAGVAGEEVPPGRHAGHRTDIKVLKLSRFFFEALKVWCFDPFVSVGRHEMSA